ncbi:hypothetical protein G6F65_017217 [Rhizopus arrhizus]|nr:hypothetical protein G6F65_017217 [Rhizopus arrhizus]
MDTAGAHSERMEDNGGVMLDRMAVMMVRALKDGRPGGSDSGEIAVQLAIRDRESKTYAVGNAPVDGRRRDQGRERVIGVVEHGIGGGRQVDQGDGADGRRAFHHDQQLILIGAQHIARDQRKPQSEQDLRGLQAQGLRVFDGALRNCRQPAADDLRHEAGVRQRQAQPGADIRAGKDVPQKGIAHERELRQSAIDQIQQHQAGHSAEKTDVAAGEEGARTRAEACQGNRQGQQQADH